jgi:hypothetical protein
MALFAIAIHIFLRYSIITEGYREQFIDEFYSLRVGPCGGPKTTRLMATKRMRKAPTAAVATATLCLVHLLV